MMMKNLEYHIEIDALPEEDGGGYLAIVPDLPGCMSDGATRAEAAMNVQGAIDEWISEAIALARPIPEPTRKQQYA